MKSKIIKAAAVVISVLVILTGVNYLRKLNRNVIDEIVAMNDMINILIAGCNSYRDNTFSFYALVTINPVNSYIGITFIPPDYRIMMNDSGTSLKKISDLDFYYFDRIRYTLKKDIQLNVPFYIKLYSSDVIRTVNLLEGIDIFSLDQPLFSSKNSFGLTYIDGEKSIQYINSAEKNSIYMKYDRILDLIMTLYNEREKRKPMLTYEFIDELFKNIKTNMMPQELFSIAEVVLKKGNIDSTLLPGSFDDDGLYKVDEISYKTYQQEFLTNLVVENETEINPKIKILNGTDIPGLARKLRNDLIRDGMNVVEFSTSPFPPVGHSIIICRKSDVASLERLSRMTGIKRIYFVTDTIQLNNILIIVGEDMASERELKNKKG